MSDKVSDKNLYIIIIKLMILKLIILMKIELNKSLYIIEKSRI